MARVELPIAIRVFEDQDPVLAFALGLAVRLTVRLDDPDAAAVVAEAEVGAAFELVGNEVGVLDDAAVHIDDVERVVRPVRQEDGAEPVVRRGEELDTLLGGCADERSADQAAEQVARWL